MQSKGNDDRMFCDGKARSENQVKEVGRGGINPRHPDGQVRAATSPRHIC